MVFKSTFIYALIFQSAVIHNEDNDCFTFIIYISNSVFASQNATRSINNQCYFLFRHQLYELIYRDLGVNWVYYIIYTLRLLKLKVAWQNSKPVACKMHAFLQNAISFALLYSGFV